mgnify:CR=1 FL=1
MNSYLEEKDVSGFSGETCQQRKAAAFNYYRYHDYIPPNAQDAESKEAADQEPVESNKVPQTLTHQSAKGRKDAQASISELITKMQKTLGDASKAKHSHRGAKEKARPGVYRVSPSVRELND